MTTLSADEVDELLDAVAYALDDADFRLSDGYVGDWCLEEAARDNVVLEHASKMKAWANAIAKLEREVRPENELVSEAMLDLYVGEESECYAVLHKEEPK